MQSAAQHNNAALVKEMTMMTIITVITNDSEIEKPPPLPKGFCVSGLAHGFDFLSFPTSILGPVHRHRERKETTHIISLQQWKKIQKLFSLSLCGFHLWRAVEVGWFEGMLNLKKKKKKKRGKDGGVND